MSLSTNMGPISSRGGLERDLFLAPPDVTIFQGPYRSNEASLVPLEFDLSQMPRWVKKILDRLPRGVVIVSGFARGLFTGDFDNVSDLDIVVPEMWSKELHELRDIVFRFIFATGYRWGWEYAINLINIEYIKNRLLPVEEKKYFDPFDGPWTETNMKFEDYCEDAVISRWSNKKWNKYPIKPNIWNRKCPKLDVMVARDNNLDNLIASFDISLAQFVYINGTLFATRIALDDLEKGQFRLLRDTRQGRVSKYRAKGYRYIEGSYCEVEYGGVV